jgi:hypothetical protein
LYKTECIILCTVNKQIMGKRGVCKLKIPHLTSTYFSSRSSTQWRVNTAGSASYLVFKLEISFGVYVPIHEVGWNKQWLTLSCHDLMPNWIKWRRGFWLDRKMDFRYSAHWPRIVAVLLRVCVSLCDSSGTGLTDGRSMCLPMRQFGYQFNGWTKFVSAHVTVRVPGLTDGRSLSQPMQQYEYRFNGWTKSVSAHVTVRVPV